MAATTLNARRAPVGARFLQVLVLLAFSALVIWATIIGFSGGHLPLAGWKSTGTVSAGVEVLIGYGGVAFLLGVIAWGIANRVSGEKS